ncbi:MAG: methyltransferase domain-containing protein [Cyanobacteria bacterium P01_H01_bin.21]
MTHLFPSLTSQSVAKFYDQTWVGARINWLNEKNLALHLGYWDEKTQNHSESLLNMNRIMASQAVIRSGERVLDAGCGFGGTTLWLAETYSAHVTGINLSGDQIRRAKHYSRKRCLENQVAFEQKNYLKTDFLNNSFDVIWAQESICHAENQQMFLQEAYRILKPGGRLIIEDCYLFNRTYSDSDKKLLQTWFSNLFTPKLPTSEQFINWAEESGFRQITLENISSYVAPSYERIKRMLVLGYPLAAILRALRLYSDMQYRYTCGMRAQQKAFQKGLWFVGLCLAHKPSETTVA